METRIFKLNPQNPERALLGEAADFIRRGGLVAFPTETVYGLGVDSRNQSAVDRVYQIKERPANKPLTIHVASRDSLDGLGIVQTPETKKIVDRFWPGPLTLIFPSRTGGRIGVRMPADRTARIFIEETGVHLAAPSANFSGEPPPVHAEEVIRSFQGKIEAIIDAGTTRLRAESTILDLTAAPYRVIRDGAVSKEELEKFFGPEGFVRERNILFVCTGNSCRSPMAAGIMQQKIKEKGKEGLFQISSAGIAGLPGTGATKEAVEIMAEIGIDISRHRSTRLTDNMLKEADLILVMEEAHRDVILLRMPEAAKKVFLLDAYRNPEPGREIPDPIGKSTVDYRQARKMIGGALERITGRL
jgi:L-threonylcarbamoyladenylate synthase